MYTYTNLRCIIQKTKNNKNTGTRHTEIQIQIQIQIHKDIDGTSVLQSALCYNCGADIIKMLIEKGADVNHKDNVAFSVLQSALCNNYGADVIKMLIENGADVNHEDNGGVSVLHEALRDNCGADVIKVLIENGADVNHKANYGWSVLQSAVYGNCGADIIKMLIEKGNDVNYKNSSGVSVLSSAAADAGDEVIGVLLESGAVDADALVKFARYDRLESVLKCLDMWKGDINKQVQGETVIHFFRNNFNALLSLLSRGAICPDLVTGEDDVARLAQDSQNVHTTKMNQVLKGHVREAQQALQQQQIEYKKNSENLQKELKEYITEGLSSIQIHSLRNDVNQAIGRSDIEVKNSIMGSADRYYHNLDHVPGGVVQSGEEAICLVFNRLLLLDSVDRGEAMFLVAQALLASANGYGWGQPVCPQGSISAMIHLLQGRIDLVSSDSKNAKLPQTIENYEELIKKVRDGDTDVVRAELQVRLHEHCSSEDLQHLFEDLQDGDAYDYAINELRGQFFSALRKEFADLLAKRQAEGGWDVNNNDEDNEITPGLARLVMSLANIANLFVEEVAGNLAGIPQIFSPFLPEEKLISVQ